MERIATALPAWLWSLIVVGLAVALALALALHWLAPKLARRAAARTNTGVDDILIKRVYGPARWLLGVAADLVKARAEMPEAIVRYRGALGFTRPDPESILAPR